MRPAFFLFFESFHSFVFRFTADLHPTQCAPAPKVPKMNSTPVGILDGLL